MKKSTTIHLIVSEEKEPKVVLKPGMKLEVIAVQLIDPSLNPSPPTAKGTLCGGSGTCVALIEV